jgi:hypothetical protein
MAAGCTGSTRPPVLLLQTLMPATGTPELYPQPPPQLTLREPPRPTLPPRPPLFIIVSTSSVNTTHACLHDHLCMITPPMPPRPPHHCITMGYGIQIQLPLRMLARGHWNDPCQTILDDYCDPSAGPPSQTTPPVQKLPLPSVALDPSPVLQPARFEDVGE